MNTKQVQFFVLKMLIHFSFLRISYLKNEKENGPTYEFYRLIKDYASEEVKGLLRNPGLEGITVFVPSNEVRYKKALLGEKASLNIQGSRLSR